MPYKLTADIGDMSRDEAAALVRAIIKAHGITFVEGVMDEGIPVASRPSRIFTSIREGGHFVGGGGGGAGGVRLSLPDKDE